MQSVSRISAVRQILAQRRQAGRRIGLVPTMGNIHAGHLALLGRCREECDFSVVTIFVNPLQFGPEEDLADYPRTLEQDRELLSRHGCDLLLHPSVTEVYGEHPELSTRVHVPELSELYCGASRPGHFDGVATVVTQLLNIVQPDSAYFGLKDYQQYLLISRLVADLNISARIVGVETSREPDGLAMSSRNIYLSETERQAAPALYRGLRSMENEIHAGARDYARVSARGREHLATAGFKVDYLDVRAARTLGPATGDDAELVILAAAILGETRLIDNLRLAIDQAPAA